MKRTSSINISRLLLSIIARLDVMTLSGVHCIYKGRNIKEKLIIKTNIKGLLLHCSHLLLCAIKVVLMLHVFLKISLKLSPLCPVNKLYYVKILSF